MEGLPTPSSSISALILFRPLVRSCNTQTWWGLPAAGCSRQLSRCRRRSCWRCELQLLISSDWNISISAAQWQTWPYWDTSWHLSVQKNKKDKLILSSICFYFDVQYVWYKECDSLKHADILNRIQVQDNLTCWSFWVQRYFVIEEGRGQSSTDPAGLTSIFWEPVWMHKAEAAFRFKHTGGRCSHRG